LPSPAQSVWFPRSSGAGATISQAQRSRGLDLDEGGFFERIRKYIPLMVPIFLSAIRSTDHLVRALESKGFGAREERTFYRVIQFGIAEYLVMAFSLIMVGVVIWPQNERVWCRYMSETHPVLKGVILPKLSGAGRSLLHPNIYLKGCM